jgi:hypothetical protein
MSFESIGWHGCLSQASVPEEVVSLARDFMALWTPYEIELIPEELRPGKIVDADDVAQIALRIMSSGHVSDEIVPGALLHRLAVFFSSAAARLSQIRGAPRSSG